MHKRVMEMTDDSNEDSVRYPDVPQHPLDGPFPTD